MLDKTSTPIERVEKRPRTLHELVIPVCYFGSLGAVMFAWIAAIGWSAFKLVLWLFF